MAMSKLCLVNFLCRSRNVLLKIDSKSNINVTRSLTNQIVTDERDPAPVFFNSNVQELLKKLTRMDLNKVYRSKVYGRSLKIPEYKFLTTAELTVLMKDAEKKAEQKLQMPPVVKENGEDPEVLSCDSEIQGFTEVKYVCSDITFGVSGRERMIVVREPDGVLRKATLRERGRINETYFPQPGRNVRIPRMFDKEHLKRLLDNGSYEFVLDKACIQFEPDDPLYQNITKETFETVDDAQHYSSLRSTRHFGPFAFHLAWNKRIDGLLLELIHTDRLEESVALVQLYHIVNPEAKSESTKLEDGQAHNFIQAYVKLESQRRAVLELALQASAELHKEQEMVKAGVRKAHGHV